MTTIQIVDIVIAVSSVLIYLASVFTVRLAVGNWVATFDMFGHSLATVDAHPHKFFYDVINIVILLALMYFEMNYCVALTILSLILNMIIVEIYHRRHPVVKGV